MAKDSTWKRRFLSLVCRLHSSPCFLGSTPGLEPLWKLPSSWKNRPGPWPLTRLLGQTPLRSCIKYGCVGTIKYTGLGVCSVGLAGSFLESQEKLPSVLSPKTRSFPWNCCCFFGIYPTTMKASSMDSPSGLFRQVAQKALETLYWNDGKASCPCLRQDLTYACFQYSTPISKLASIVRSTNEYPWYFWVPVSLHFPSLHKPCT